MFSPSSIVQPIQTKGGHHICCSFCLEIKLANSWIDAQPLSQTGEALVSNFMGEVAEKVAVEIIIAVLVGFP